MHYCSPERINQDPIIFKEDLWALGVILYQMSSFEHPFDLELSCKKSKKSLHYIHKYIENRSPELNGLITAMLQKKQENRLSIKQLFLKFPILQNAILDLLSKFASVKNSTFEKLVK
jgi:serine/threonine protein kinase